MSNSTFSTFTFFISKILDLVLWKNGTNKPMFDPVVLGIAGDIIKDAFFSSKNEQLNINTLPKCPLIKQAYMQASNFNYFQGIHFKATIPILEKGKN